MAKGGEFERDTAKFLTKWLTGKNKPYMFWRQDASGGIATVHIENNHMTGDICSLHPDSRWFTNIFSIECKTGYKQTSFWQHFTSINFGIEEFWKQACNDGEKANKLPMLIYRKKGRKIIIGIDDRAYNKLNNKLSKLNHIRICWNKENTLCDCILFDMIDFFKIIKPDDIKEIINGHFKFNKG